MAMRAERIARAEAERALYEARLAELALSAANQGNTFQPKARNLWAALSINHAVVKAGKAKELRFGFSLVNDSERVIDPRIADSQIVINCKGLTEPGSVFGKDAPFKALAPGESVQFDLPPGEHFKEPGTYRVFWKGTAFQSSEIVLRILSEKPR
jgi:hypothetical protein